MYKMYMYILHMYMDMTHPSKAFSPKKAPVEMSRIVVSGPPGELWWVTLTYMYVHVQCTCIMSTHT